MRSERISIMVSVLVLADAAAGLTAGVNWPTTKDDAVAISRGNLVSDSLTDLVDDSSKSDEPSLQEIFDQLGYNIDVTTDELGIETFDPISGQNSATVVVAYAARAWCTTSGWYLANDTGVLHQFFSSADPGASTQFAVPKGSSIGFYMCPVSWTWFTQNAMNSDHYDHTWVYRTGMPYEYLIAWEDWWEGGDGDHQDLVLKIGFYDICGDADGDGYATPADVDLLRAYYFSIGPTPDIQVEAIDMDCSGRISLNDLVLLVGYVYGFGPTPCCAPPPPPKDMEVRDQSVDDGSVE